MNLSLPWPSHGRATVGSWPAWSGYGPAMPRAWPCLATDPIFWACIFFLCNPSLFFFLCDPAPGFLCCSTHDTPPHLCRWGWVHAWSHEAKSTIGASIVSIEAAPQSTIAAIKAAPMLSIAAGIALVSLLLLAAWCCSPVREDPHP